MTPAIVGPGPRLRIFDRRAARGTVPAVLGPPSLRRILPVIALLGAPGCTSDEWPPNGEDDDDDPTGSSPGEPTPTGVRIEVFEPRTPSIHYLGDAVPLLAEVRDATDLPFAYDEIVWQADGYGPTLLVGAEGDATLPPGAYDITATAVLANGDRLAATVGGIRVQTPWTGTYSGDTTLVLSAMFQGIPVAPRCVGDLTLRVDYDGEDVEITGGSCTINAIILTFDASYEIEGTFTNGVGQGTIDYDLGGLFNLSFDWTGAFVEEGFRGTFSGDVTLPLIGDLAVTGNFDADLDSPWLEEPAP